jgi:iron complex transport system ATP-binding protein
MSADRDHHAPQLEAVDLDLRYESRRVVENLSLRIPAGRITTIVGPNGCGKSTLLRGIARILKPAGGQVLLDGASIHRLPTKVVAQRIGILPQSPTAPEGLTIEDLVGRGRYPHQSMFRRWSAADEAAVEAALEATALSSLRERPVDELSGGQRQRAWIAMALAQETAVLLLDEPTTYLDLAHQVEVLDLLADLNEHDRRTIVMVLHDINQAARYSHEIVAMKDGAITHSGAPADIIDAAFIRDVFGLEAHVFPDPVDGTPLCLPLHRRAGRVVAGAAGAPAPLVRADVPTNDALDARATAPAGTER